MNTAIRRTSLASCIALIFGAANAEAALVTNVLGANTWSTDSANFEMLHNGDAGVVGGTNDVVMHWDGNAYNASSDYTGPGSVANVTMSSATTPFFGHMWTAHDIQMFVPGSYSFDVTLGGGGYESGTLNVTVPTGDLGMHMLFDWNGNINNDIFVVFARNSVFGSGLLYSTQTNSGGAHTCDAIFTGTITKNCLYDGSNYGSAGAPVKNQAWMLASTDGDGDGTMGVAMAPGGVFAGFSFNFNASLTPTPKPVPIPTAAWLFGSGLMALFAAARRWRKVHDSAVG